MDSSANSQLLPGSRGRNERIPDHTLYHDKAATQSNRIMVLAFIGVVLIMVIITFVLSIYRSATSKNGGLYLLIGLSLLGFIVIELIMMQFVKRGDLPQEKSWFLYFVGGCIVLEALFTDILLFQ